MCGIAGIYRTDGGSADPLALTPILEALHHRGPDGSGECHQREFAIGMTRLAIIDVAGGQQPIYNEDGTVAIVCNGEIYNHQELRRELEGRGHRFRTHSDIEVIVHLYEEVGESCFERLNGMFGAAIVDFVRRRLILGRDPFGQKSLYLWQSPQGFVFASELKALAADKNFPRRVSPAAVAAFLQYRYVPAPLTIFDNVEKVPPGSIYVFEPTGVRRRRYYQIDFSPSAVGRRHDPGGELTREALMHSVERHLMSERPLGVFLSGGVDSSAIVACMHANGHRDIHTFSVGFEDYWDNELAAAREVAAHFKTQHHEVVLDADAFWDSLDDVCHSADEPLADLTTVPLYHLSRKASQEVVVVLSGEGADELLAGYQGLEQLRRKFNLLDRVRPLSPVAGALAKLPLPGPLRRRLHIAASSAADYLGSAPELANTHVFSQELRASQFINGLGQIDVFAPLASYYRLNSGWDGMHLYLGGMIEWWLPDDLLHKADRMSMAHSIELRCPFLDREFALHCASLDLDSKVRPRTGEMNRKRALKKAFEAALPPGLVTRRKRGFSIPAYEWLRTVYKDRATREMGRADAFGTSLVKRGVAPALMERAAAGDVESQRRVWSLIVLNKWGDRWL